MTLEDSFDGEKVRDILLKREDPQHLSLGQLTKEIVGYAQILPFIDLGSGKPDFILKSGLNTPQLAATDFKRQKLLVAKRKISREYPSACCGDSEILGNFFIVLREAIGNRLKKLYGELDQREKYYLNKEEKE